MIVAAAEDSGSGSEQQILPLPLLLPLMTAAATCLQKVLPDFFRGVLR